MGDSEANRSCLLIAMPQLSDPNFTQTTTLISEFTAEGAMGLILNRPLNISLDQVMSGTSGIEVKRPITAYWGGPVQNNTGWILHEDEAFAKESLVVRSGLYLTSSPSALKKMTETTESPGTPRYRFFLGYAGWGNGQLEQEMAASSWVTAPVKTEFIFDHDPKTLWLRSLQSIGITPQQLQSIPQSEAN